MNFKAKVFVSSGIYALLGVFIARYLIFQYNYGEGGINFLPINFFEILLYLLAVLVTLITVLSLFIIGKRSKAVISAKIKIRFFLSLIIGGIILFFLVQKGYSNYVVSAALIIYGITVLQTIRHTNSSLLILVLAEVVLAVTAFVMSDHNMLFLTLGLGVFPILYGMIQSKK